MWHEEGEKDECGEGIEIHAELQWRQTEAGEDSEEAVEAGDLIEYHAQRDHLSSCAQAHNVKESLCLG